MMSGLASKKDLLPSAVVTVIIIGVIYGAYFLATYFGSKNIIKEEYWNCDDLLEIKRMIVFGDAKTVEKAVNILERKTYDVQ